MFDGLLALRAVEHALTSDSELMALISAVVNDIYDKDEEAPADAFPFVNISEMDQDDVYYNGTVRAKTDQQLMVYAIQRFTTNGSYGGTLQTIAERIETLLHGQCVTVYDTDDVTAIGHAYITRMRPMKARFVDGAAEYHYLGGQYLVNTNKY